MNTVLNYWNVHGIGTQKQLLIIGDAALYDQRVNIEKLLPDDFVATTVSFSANVSCESVLKTVPSSRRGRSRQPFMSLQACDRHTAPRSLLGTSLVSARPLEHSGEAGSAQLVD